MKLEVLQHLLSQPKLWFLDYDGTFCPHGGDDEQRSLYIEQTVKILAQLNSQGHQFVWNTGRHPSSLWDESPEFARYPGYYAFGTMFVADGDQEIEYLVPKLKTAEIELVKTFLKKYPKALRINQKETTFYVRLWGEDIDSNEFSRWIVKNWDMRALPNRYWRINDKSANLLSSGFNKASAIQDYLSKISIKLPLVSIGDDDYDKEMSEAVLASDGYSIMIGKHGFVGSRSFQVQTPEKWVQLLKDAIF